LKLLYHQLIKNDTVINLIKVW